MSSPEKPLLEHATRDLASFASRLKFEDIPAAVIERIRDSTLDSIGCCLHGVTLPWTRKVQDMVLAEGAAPVASIFGGGGRTSVSQAVLVNATAGHAFELDDIHKESIVHPGSLAIPVAVALAEASGGTSGRDLITAMVAGYEIGTRVGNAATMSLFLRGFHPQGTSSAFVEQYREDRLRDPRILDFIGRIAARVDPEIEAMGPAFRHAARVRIETRDGRTFSREILHRRGSPENPLKPGDIEYKFRNVAKGCLAPRRLERVIELCKTLDRLPDTRELIAILAAPAGQA